MKTGRIAGVGLPVSCLIQGTLTLDRDGEDAAFALLDAAFESGCNAFDTAIVYGRGAQERLLGRWITNRGLRSATVIIDKGCHPLGSVPRVSPSDLRDDLLRSLDHLQTDYIDLYLLHRDNLDVPVSEIIDALNEHLAAGRIRAFGASNWTHDRIQRAHEYAASHGRVSFAASSPGFSLAEPVKSWPGCISIHPRRRDAWEWYRATRMPVLAWSPLAAGFLTGRITRRSAQAPADRHEQQVLDFYASDANFERLERLTQLAGSRGISVAQAALAYVMHAPLDIYAVVGCRSPNEVKDCVLATAVPLSASELASLDRSECSRDSG